MFYAIKIAATKKAKPDKLTDELDRRPIETEDIMERIDIDIKRNIVRKPEAELEEGEPAETDNLETILNEAEALVADATEYEIDYHICSHDEEIHRPCGNWNRGREKKAAKAKTATAKTKTKTTKKSGE